MKEAAARIKINNLLENAGWRFFADASGSATIRLEPSVTLKSQDLDGMAVNRELITSFEKKIQATRARIWGEEASAA